MLFFIVYWLYSLFLGLPAPGLKSLGSEKHPNHTGNIKTQNQPDENWARSWIFVSGFHSSRPPEALRLERAGHFSRLTKSKYIIFFLFFIGSFSFNGKEDESRCEVVLSARWNAVESVLHVFTWALTLGLNDTSCTEVRYRGLEKIVNGKSFYRNAPLKEMSSVLQAFVSLPLYLTISSLTVFNGQKCETSSFQSLDL